MTMDKIGKVSAFLNKYYLLATSYKTKGFNLDIYREKIIKQKGVIKMIPKILFSLATTILAELSLILYQYDNPSGFIPLMETLSNHNGIAAYDCFVIISLIYHKIIFNHFGISLSSLRNLFLIFSNSRPMEILAVVLTAAITHFFICPFLLVIFLNPIQEIVHSGDAVRKAVIFQIPLSWICLITFIQKIPSGFIGNIQPPRWQP